MKALSKMVFLLVVLAAVSAAAVLPHIIGAADHRQDVGISFCGSDDGSGGGGDDDGGGKDFAVISTGSHERLG